MKSLNSNRRRIWFVLALAAASVVLNRAQNAAPATPAPAPEIAVAPEPVVKPDQAPAAPTEPVAPAPPRRKSKRNQPPGGGGGFGGAVPAPEAPAAPSAMAGFGGGFGGGGIGPDNGGIGGPRALSVPGNRSGSSRESVPPIMVEFGNSDPTKTQHLEEDLAVMSHVFSQALERGLGEEAPESKLGVPLLYTGSGRSVRAMYLGGFGALFMIKVNMPLMAAPAPDEPKTSLKSTDSEWETARREALGLDNKEEMEWLTATESETPFDADQVEALKRVVLSSLKNAANIRALKPDESVSVAIFGQPMARSINVITGAKGGRARTAPGEHSQVTLSVTSSAALDGAKQEVEEAGNDANAPDKPNPPVVVKSGRSRGKGSAGRNGIAGSTSTSVNNNFNILVTNGSTQKGTVITLRVMKAQIDAFAEGKMSLEDFAKKVTFTSYEGNGYGITSVNSWIQSGRNNVRY